MNYITIILFMLSISAHELGHAFAFRRHGVPLQEISLLGFGPTLFTFKIRKWFGDTPIRIKLIPLGAFVKPVNNDYENNLKNHRKAHIMGAGIMANFLYAGILWGAIAIILPESEYLGAKIWVLACISIILGIFPRFTWVIIPIIGTAILALLVFALTKNPAAFTQNTGGAVMIVQEINKNAGAMIELPVQIQIMNAISFAAYLSISVGIFQALPFYPLDGGRIMVAYITQIFPVRIREKCKTAMILITLVPLLALIITALSGDLVRIIKLF
ncbi:MAG TPA: M50 family metallopeptidase [Candidatus Paceibacterota bacterium]|nr:M50 family metallopeptidase [Candidatus Paceibacterota bacterium]